MKTGHVEAVEIPLPHRGLLGGDLTTVVPAGPVVVFAHGSGSSRHSPRNQAVARYLQRAGLGTLLLDLLTEAEERAEQRGGRLRFDVDQLAERLVQAIDWLDGQEQERPRTLGCFGASTGAACALAAAVVRRERVAAVVSRGGRPDLAGSLLPLVGAPTLLIVGGQDPVVRQLNERAFAELTCECRLEVVPGATHLFEEPGALERVADLAADWFTTHLG